MSLKRKTNQYDVVWSYKKDPSNWKYSRVSEDNLQIAVMNILSNPDMQLECAALVASSNPNRFELSLPS